MTPQEFDQREGQFVEIEPVLGLPYTKYRIGKRKTVESYDENDNCTMKEIFTLTAYDGDRPACDLWMNENSIQEKL